MQQQVKSRSATRCLFVATAAVAPTILAASIASAVTRDWSATAATSAWATGSNWDGGTAPASSNADAARFNKTSYLNQPDTGTRTVGGLIVGDGTTATAALTIGGTSLALGASGIGTGITINANAGQTTITTALSLGATQSWTNDSANLFTVGSVNLVNRALTVTGSGNTLISGGISATTGTLTKDGAGTLTFGATNSYTGQTTVNGGTIDLAGLSQTMGRVINEGTITNSSATPVTLTIGNRSQGSGSYTGKMDVIFDNGVNNSSIFGGFQHTGNLTLKANGAGNISLTTSAVNNTGTITNSGTGTGTTTIHTVGPNVTGVIQNSATSVLSFTEASPDWTSGLLIQRGTVNLGNDAAAAGAATNTLTIGDATVGADARLNTTASAGAGPQPIVVAAGSGTRTIGNTTAPNATFSGSVSLNNDLIVSNDAVVNGGSGLTLSGGITGTGNLLIQGNSATTTAGFYQGVRLTAADSTKVVNNVGSITNAGTGAHDSIISAAIGTNVTGVIQNSATSRLVLSGDNTYTAPTTVTAGTLQLAAGGSLANGNITVASGGTFETQGQTGGTEEIPEVTPASILTFNIDDASTFDAIANAGTVTLGGDITLDFAATLVGGTFVDLFTGSGSYSSTVGQVLVSGAYNGALTGSGSQFSGTFGNQEISFNAATGDLAVTEAVPEPGSLAALGLAASGLLLRRRRR